MPHDVTRPVSACLLSALMLALLISPLSNTAFAAKVERPSAMKLFPEEAVIFIRMANGHEFGEKFQQTALGRMIHDPQMQPFVDSLYGKAGNLYAQQAEDKVGISWEDVKKLPKGEVAFAVVARSGRRPGLLMLVDQGDEVSVADKLVDKVLDMAEKKGGEFSKEKIGDVDVTVVRATDRKDRMFGVFERDNTIVAATDADLLRNVIWHWDHAGEATPSAAATAETSNASNSDSPAKDKAEKKKEVEFVPTRTLAENTKFTSILKECRRKQDPPAHLVVYADPIGLAKNLGRDNPGLTMALAMMPMLGIDGISAIGGAITYATNEYDSLVQVHLLLDNPRSGVLQLPAFESGDTTPQQFVPKAVESYTTWSWNLRATYDRLLVLLERFGAKTSVDRFLEDQVKGRFGIDLPSQILDNLKGRYTWTVGFDHPTHLRGQQHVFAVELKDEKAIADALKTVIGKYPDKFAEKHFGKVTYHAIVVRPFKDMPEDQRPMNPFVAVTNGYLFLGTSIQQFENCISALDGTADRLADSEDYKRAIAVIGRETTGVTPVLFSVHRFEETVKQWYELLTSPKIREQLSENKKKNPVLSALAELLEQNKLPPFEVLAPYFVSSGSILYDTDNGYHGISFALRNEAPK